MADGDQLLPDAIPLDDIRAYRCPSCDVEWIGGRLGECWSCGEPVTPIDAELERRPLMRDDPGYGLEPPPFPI